MPSKKKIRVLTRQGSKAEQLELEVSQEAEVEDIKSFIEGMDLEFLGLEESLFNDEFR